MSGKPIDEAVAMLEALQERWCASTAGKPGARRIATFDSARAAQGEDDFDNEVSATRRCASDLALAIERIRALTAAQQQGQAVACQHERKHAEYDCVVCDDCGAIYTDSGKSWPVKNTWFASRALAQQPAAVDEAAAIRAFEEHFEASAEDPSFEGELELWLTAWRKALSAQHQEPKS